MDNFQIQHEMDFPIYRKEIKTRFLTLLKIRKIPYKWHTEKDMAYIGYFSIKFFSTSEMSDFFLSMGSIFSKND